MNKSLAPLIAVFALIILLTLIVLNSDYGVRARPPLQKNTETTEIRLRPDSDTNPAAQHVQPAGNSAMVDSGDMLGRARNLLASGKNKEAEDNLRTLLVFDPDNRQALSLLGGILFYSGRYREAEMIFRHQINLDPNNSLAYNRLGSALAKQKKYRAAIDSSSVAMGMNPNSGEAHINLAGMYAVTGDRKKALVHFRKAYELLGTAILPLSYDESFNLIRSMEEFQEIISEAKSRLKKYDIPEIRKKSMSAPLQKNPSAPPEHNSETKPLFQSDKP